MILALLLALAGATGRAQGVAGPPPDARPPGASPGKGVRGITLPRGAILEEVSEIR